MSRIETSGLQLEERRVAIEILSIRERTRQAGIVVKWCDSDQKLAETFPLWSIGGPLAVGINFYRFWTLVCFGEKEEVNAATGTEGKSPSWFTREISGFQSTRKRSVWNEAETWRDNQPIRTLSLSLEVVILPQLARSTALKASVLKRALPVCPTVCAMDKSC